MVKYTKATRLGRGKAGLVLAVLLVVGAAGGVAVAAPTKPVVPTPTITSRPANPTGSSVASFTYSNTLSGVTYSCSLDGASSQSCPTAGVSYTGLQSGDHTFAVVASYPGRTGSAPASYAWTIDRTAPTIAISSLVGGQYRAASWPSCGICGTASDPTGVSSVRLSVYQHATKRYWSGAAFDSSASITLPATGSTNWSYGIQMPSDGRYLVSVFATDGLGNSTAPGSPTATTFFVDNVAPAVPEITKSPSDPSTSTSPQFLYRSSERGSTFKCSLDGGAFVPCPENGVTYDDIEEGDHCFSVLAIDEAGNTGPSSSAYCWTILLNKTFGIKGQVVGLLAPGATRSIDLEFTNPYNFVIFVHSVEVTIGESTNEDECPGATNLENSRSMVGPVALPANSTKKLSELPVTASRWPEVSMPNLETSQDGCKGVSFRLSYAGTASK